MAENLVGSLLNLPEAELIERFQFRPFPDQSLLRLVERAWGLTGDYI
jgi:hypothetical protein